MKIKRYITHPLQIVFSLGMHGFFQFLDDQTYIKMMYYCAFRKYLNLDIPQTFNEKIQWLKLYNRNPLYTTLVDKQAVKQYVSKTIGNQYIIPTLGVWDKFEDIDFDSLPDQFVLKCTHDSGGLVICKDKSKFNYKEARSKISKCLKRNYYWIGREWPYKNVKPRIIAETYMENRNTTELYDYKFFCFGGQAKCFKVDFDRFIEHHANYYDEFGTVLKFGEMIYPPIYDKSIDLPDSLSEMISLSEKLSKNVPFLRADFYDVDGKIYFGELTFYPSSGFGKFTSDEWDNILGQWISLPETFGGGDI